MKRALVLFGHGARDARWAEPFQRLRQVTQTRMPDVAVSLAFLEFMVPALPDLVSQLRQEAMDEITVVPVFFGQGGHVLRDVPLMIDKLRNDHPDLVLKLAAAVGEDPDVLEAIAGYCVRVM